jgi:hypothetical protein
MTTFQLRSMALRTIFCRRYLMSNPVCVNRSRVPRPCGWIIQSTTHRAGCSARRSTQLKVNCSPVRTARTLHEMSPAGGRGITNVNCTPTEATNPIDGINHRSSRYGSVRARQTTSGDCGKNRPISTAAGFIPVSAITGTPSQPNPTCNQQHSATDRRAPSPTTRRDPRSPSPAAPSQTQCSPLPSSGRRRLRRRRS